MTNVKSKPKKKLLTMRRKEEIQGYLFLSPWMIGFICLTAGPMLYWLYGSFTNYDVTSRMDFIGFDNYIRMFTNDDLFWTSLWNTIYYVIFFVPLTRIGAIVLALLLNQGVPGMRLYRTIFYLPAVLSGVGVYLLWMQLLAPSTGLVNNFLSLFGIQGPAWLTDPAWTKNALIFMKMWSVGGSMLLYLASLQGVLKSLYEAAEIDGAKHFSVFSILRCP